MPPLRLAYRAAYRGLQVRSALLHPSVRGVKCVLRDGAGRLLFVRHHYGARHKWELPGGGVHRGELPGEAVVREAREELGVSGLPWRLVGEQHGFWHHKTEVLSVYEAPWPGGVLRPDPVEIAHLGWFRAEAPPAALGPTTESALALLTRSRGS